MLVLTSFPHAIPGVISLSQRRYAKTALHLALAFASTVYHRTGERRRHWATTADYSLAKLLIMCHVAELCAIVRNGTLRTEARYGFLMLICGLFVYAAGWNAKDDESMYVPLHALWHVVAVIGDSYAEMIVPKISRRQYRTLARKAG